MYNYFMLIGTITNVDVKNDVNNFDVEVMKPFKNEQGEFETQRFNLSFKRFADDNVMLVKGAKIGVKGHLDIVGDRILTIVDRLRFVGYFDKEVR